jgi:mannose-6-phosphate isomerase-like protein (cupin superfamily)
VRWVLQPGETPLFGSERGCAEFEQRLLRFDGSSGNRSNAAEDEVLYVLAGRGSVRIDGGAVELATGTAAYVARGIVWRVEDADELEILSVLVNDPLPANGARHSVVEADDVQVSTATAGREFRLLATPEIGCPTVTQFVGYIPVGRAPDHFHRYDEVGFVLEGEGAAHIEGETVELRAGSCFHLPSGLVHCLENTGPGEMKVLAVFRPAGSPAEAYYPDGTKADY